MVMVASIQRGFFDWADRGAGLTERIAGERHAGELTLGEIALDGLFNGSVGWHFRRVVGGRSTVGMWVGHRKSPE